MGAQLVAIIVQPAGSRCCRSLQRCSGLVRRIGAQLRRRFQCTCSNRCHLGRCISSVANSQSPGIGYRHQLLASTTVIKRNFNPLPAANQRWWEESPECKKVNHKMKSSKKKKKKKKKILQKKKKKKKKKKS